MLDVQPQPTATATAATATTAAVDAVLSSPPDFDFTFHPSVSKFNVAVTDFLASQTEYEVIATGALVFDNQDRLLLIQRAAHDSMPSRWEIPGGAVDLDDKTVLHGVARELWEETGLLLKRVGRQVPSSLDGPEGALFFSRRGRRICKFTFESEIQEDGADGTAPVKLDPNEHQRYLWVTEDECRAHRTNSNVELVFTTTQQEDTILQGFKIRKEPLAN